MLYSVGIHVWKQRAHTKNDTHSVYIYVVCTYYAYSYISKGMQQREQYGRISCVVHV